MFERITAQLMQSALTEQQLACKLGMHHETLRRKLEGREPFTLDEAVRLKAALGLTDSIEALFCEQESVTQENWKYIDSFGRG